MPQLMDERVWRARAAAHHARVDALVADHLERRRDGVAHPVHDFLFTYYSFRPAQLRRWHPGYGVVLAGRETEAVTDADVAARRSLVERTHELLAATAGRPANLGCFGMHEWAMVYRLPPERVRHAAWPLRLTPERIAATVEERGARCSHFDAYRFFTEPARRLNVLAPTRERQVELEQPGCLHANMDLYKWACKLMPIVPSALVLDCFELARDIRTLDMRASPYDLSALGYSAVPIETPAGKAEYAAAQRSFAARARPLRLRLVELCDELLG